VDRKPTDLISTAGAHEAIPVVPVTGDTLEETRRGDERLNRWVRAHGFEAKADTWLPCPDAQGRVERVLLGVDPDHPHRAFGAAARGLPAGLYHLGEGPVAVDPSAAALWWGLGAYRYTAYQDPGREPARWVVDAGVDTAAVAARIEAVWRTRDLVNTPASDLMPGHLAAAARDLAERFGATVEETVGEALVEAGYPMVHAVGRASHHAPRVVDLRWGRSGPRVTVVGKGVCFDSGGLDLKDARGMRLMKKDMAGAAQALGLARLVMARDLPVRLRVLIPAVENAVGGNAFRPGDVLRARDGRTVEIDNTDAEGRLILADCLAAAGEEEPELIVDFATITGEARVAVGTELPALFTPDDLLARDLLEQAAAADDPLWRLPLHDDYRYLLDSEVADIKNCASEPYAGAVTAALFLREFVPGETDWVHLDFMGWNLRDRPGRPKGGEAQGLLGVFAWLEQRYA
jgi:leucyl aminopeptidase